MFFLSANVWSSKTRCFIEAPKKQRERVQHDFNTIKIDKERSLVYILHFVVLSLTELTCVSQCVIFGSVDGIIGEFKNKKMEFNIHQPAAPEKEI